MDESKQHQKQHQFNRQNNWVRENTTRWQIQLNNINDADIIEWLHLMGRSAAGQVRKLIRDDIKRRSQE